MNFIRLKLCLTAAATLLLCSCSTFQPLSDEKPAELNGRQILFSRTVRGEMIFTCDWDAQGAYWRFVRPAGKIFKDNVRTGTLNEDWSVTDLKNNRLKMTPEKTFGTASAGNLRNLLFRITTPGSQVVYIERKDGTGGMPLTRCSAAQRGQLLRVPFSATYIYWH